MKQKPIPQWYSTVEPDVQIELLKEIAFKEHSQTSLKTKFKNHISSSTIDISISKLKTNYELIQFSREEKITDGKRARKILGLTEKGIKVLVESHYADNKKNTEKGIVDEPYLTTKELGILLFNIFENKYSSYNNNEKKLDEWKKPNISMKDVIKLYQKANPDVVMNEFKPKSKFQMLSDKINSLENELAQMLYESWVNANK